MASTLRGAKTSEEIRSVAVSLIHKHGFQAASLRDIAAGAGIRVGSLYNHITSKDDLLFSIMETVMADLIEGQTELAQTPDVADRLRLMIRFHVRFHGERASEVFIGNSELRSLNPSHRTAIIRMRHEYEVLFRTVLEEGIRLGRFRQVDVTLTTFGILAMMSSFSPWYSLRGRRSLADVATV